MRKTEGFDARLLSRLLPLAFPSKNEAIVKLFIMPLIMLLFHDTKYTKNVR